MGHYFLDPVTQAITIERELLGDEGEYSVPLVGDKGSSSRTKTNPVYSGLDSGKYVHIYHITIPPNDKL